MVAITVFSQPRPVRTLHRSDAWTAAALVERLPRAFKGALTPLEGTAEYFDREAGRSRPMPDPLTHPWGGGKKGP